MSEPFRDLNLTCPACNAPLRAFRTRLVCDACEGMFAPLADLSAAIEEITGVVPGFDYRNEEPGKRACPACHAAMTTLKLKITLEEELAKPSPKLDRCAEHGLWFDRDELADVFETCRSKHPGGSGARPTGAAGSRPGPGKSGWSGDSRGPFWWGGGHGNY